MRRYRYVIHGLSTGGISLGILQALGGIDYNGLWSGFLTTLLTMLVQLFVTVLFGVDPNEVLNFTNQFGGLGLGSLFL
ncbi:MAG TPA: hypothetical protein VM487_17080 [Phycisphaerae bacterium]|nr:hypothetical protein [Phycisphaerae bacterium]